MSDAARTGAHLIAEALVNNGVERVFCVPGESFLALLDALPSARKRNAAYQEVLADISKRKAGNLLKAGEN